ncbi:5'-methylthioadenosine/S-adenosylhomocysteine nucleosidase [Tolumonas auensis]|uniref:5'-methylthioadenosine/S-adenosylhomocysteine nucleosidase n=1 Tax=Tolumonas auensis TaxID=43948 RepID=UPI002AA64A4C|nr:5'-methylthioadenosine/S-adenosylhomocysteine nucleosidase [Tolumonas auensis]
MKIGIIGAMEPEVAILREQISNMETLSIAGCEFYRGELAGHDVILTRSGIGKVAASIATTILLDRYAPDCVINTGSAGGFDPELRVGDVVISDEVRHHDVNVTAFGYEPGQLPQQPAAFISDSKLIEVATQVMHQLPELQSRIGLICTGDQFMCDPDHIEQVRQTFPSMMAAEMEAAAIAQVCHQFKVPFVVIRSLSDIAGTESPSSFEEYLEVAAKNSSAMIVAMLKQL